MGSIFIWWLLISAFGILALPITLKTFQFLPDRGYGFSKPLGLLLVGFLSWLFGFVHFSVITIILAALFLGGISYWIFSRYRDELIATLRAQKNHILVNELFFILLLFMFAFFRMYNADILGTEKFMDMAFLNAISRSPGFPPYDPWLSGSFSISYYYFGYLLMAILLKLSGTAPAIGFNLSLAMLFALSGISVFTLLYNLTRRLSFAFGGWGIMYMLGNLDGFKQVLTTRSIGNFNWWTPSRVVADTINEFPFFSFLLGDMHPHMLAVPFVLIGLAFGLNHLLSDEPAVTLKDPAQLGRFSLWGLVIGALGFLNSWDLPSVFFVALLCIFLQQYRLRSNWRDYPWKGMAAAAGLMLALMVIPYLPFYIGFQSQAKGIDWTTQNTRVGDFLLIFGMFAFMALTFLIARYHHWFVTILKGPGETATSQAPAKKFCAQCGSRLREGKKICGQCGYKIPEVPAADKEASLQGSLSSMPEQVGAFFRFILQPMTALSNSAHRLPAYITLGVLVAVGAAVALKAAFFGGDNNPQPYLMALSMLFIVAVALLLATKIDRSESVFALVLLITAGLLVFGCETLHINDTFSPPLDRMNTVFKFYYMTWFLSGIAGVYGVFWTLKYSMRRPQLKVVWLLPMVLLIAASMVYPYASVMIKTNRFANLATLDGSYYLKNTYPADRAGIEWLRKNIKGNPVVLEATGGEYTDFARVSTFTGLPTVLGWGGHELQWRGNYDEPGKRIPDIDTLYGSADIEQTRILMDKYNIMLVFVGTLERQKYAGKDLAKFGRFMEKVFEHPGGVAIYRRK